MRQSAVVIPSGMSAACDRARRGDLFGLSKTLLAPSFVDGDGDGVGQI
jgi:hypothetical protein